MGSRSKAVLREDGGDPCKIWRYNDDEDDGDNDDHDPEDGDDGDGENSDERDIFSSRDVRIHI